MKFTLAFHVFNKEKTLQSVLDSWLSRLSGRHEVEVVVVCDDMTDHSDEVARRVLDGYGAPYRILYALNGWEMGCDNLALAVATGDVIITIQDDNWMFTPEWDVLLADIFEAVPRVGAVGLLAGVEWQKDSTYRRIECYTPHKGENFTTHNIPRDAYPPGLWQADYVTRPLAIQTAVLRELRGFDWAYWPMDWDESDMSWRAHLGGYTNVIAPFDLRNEVRKHDTIGKQRATENFVRGRSTFMSRHAASILERRMQKTRCLIPIQVTHCPVGDDVEWRLELERDH